eukprot:1225538-Amphidinium_carterae.1
MQGPSSTVQKKLWGLGHLQACSPGRLDATNHSPETPHRAQRRGNWIGTCTVRLMITTQTNT